MGLRYVVAAALAILVLAGCGARTCQGCANDSGPITGLPGRAAAGFDVLITDKDQDVTVHAGQKIEVYLRQRSGLTVWTGLRTDAEAVLAPIPTGLLAPAGATIGGFQAVTAGVANITATATADCSPGKPCPMFAALFSVRVTVL